MWPVLLLASFLLFSPTSTSSTFSYSQFLTEVTDNKVKTASIDQTGAVTGTLLNGTDYTSRIPTALNDQTLSGLLQTHKVAVSGVVQSTSSTVGTLFTWLPLLLLAAFLLWSVNSTRKRISGSGGLGSVLGIGRSTAKVYDEERPATRFSDVAGYRGSKLEVMEVVDYLKHPERYAEAGAVGPKGVLMVGPPGTGKTLLARAVAGEAGVPFFALSGSSFVEMFVGVGAARVRSLFADARKRAPSIIFIDEIDAIGGRRGHGYGGNDEREQTLNQLLSEMDGFEPGTEVVVIAATNRMEILDPALLRPGRFDRTVEIPLPTLRERAEILAIHCRGKVLAPDVILDDVARGTVGFSGADLANLANEAAINAVRDRRRTVQAADFDAARDRLLLGRRDPTNALLDAGEKHAVAVHEAGHAVVAILTDRADPVAKVTILPRGAALGATQQLPAIERHLYQHSYLSATLAVQLGGRAAELAVLGEGSSGAANDLAVATALATRMVREWGLSGVVGPVGYTANDPESPLAGRPYAEATQRSIDSEVARLLREAETQATSLIEGHRAGFTRVVDLLLEQETVDGAQVQAALVGPPVLLKSSVPLSRDSGPEQPGGSRAIMRPVLP